MPLGFAISILGKAAPSLWRLCRRPVLEALPFDESRDLREWTLVGTISRVQRVFTIEIRNTGFDVAKRCVGLLEINAAGAPDSQMKLYAVHWADVDYAFRTSGAETVDIGPEGRRLDVAFTYSGQPRDGCWIATPSALVAPLATPDWLAPGAYDARVIVRAQGALRSLSRFRIHSPAAGSNLSILPC
jgi:hypothetical protein